MFVSIYDILKFRFENDPEALALIHHECIPLTYGCLYQHVNDLGTKLRQFGLSRDDRVAIVLPNAAEMAVAFLTVAAEAISAPVNPQYRAPEFHAAFSILRATAVLLAADVDSPAREAAHALGMAVIEVESVTSGPAGRFTMAGTPRSEVTSRHVAQPDDIALLLPTSGTTAQPKLVPLTHRNLCVSAQNVARTLQLSAADRCLNVMPLFHIHGLVVVTLATLAAGASLVCPAAFDVQQFFAWMAAYRPTWYTAVPTIHQAILAQATTQQDVIARSPLRFIRSSSAPLPPRVMQALEQAFGVPVIEAYGMTEAAHQMCSNPLPPGQRKAGSAGRPAGPDVAIMDADGTLLPPGQEGEIVIRGDNVMGGYADHSAANTIAWMQGWFRTGDYGRFDDDGYLFITGRLKEIINRGGEKVAPREVEETLLDHPLVAQAVVFSMPHTRLGEDVAAAVVLRDSATATERELRTFVRARLAEWKVPSRIVYVDSLPTGPSGKLQRVGLHDMFASLLTTTFVVPRTEVEATLAQLWADLLEVERVGIHDAFLQLGGDSLIATRLLARVHETFHRDVPFRLLLEASTVAEMAALLTEPQTAQATPGPAIVPRESAEPCALSFAQQRLWFLAQFEPDTPIYNEGRAFRLAGSLQVQALQQALTELVARHEVLRTVFVMHAHQPLQVVTVPQPVSLTIIDLQHYPTADRDAEVDRQLIKAIHTPFDLTSDLMLRATLLRLEATDHVLLLVFHHIASDGWSMSVVLRELSLLYNACLRSVPSPLAPLPLQYADYASWQRRWYESDKIQAQLTYWKQQLDGAPTVLALPTDRPRPAVQTYYGARQYFHLPASLCKTLKALSQQEGVTLFMLLLAAFQTLLLRYTGQTDILVGSPIAGRTRAETEGLIGFFVNTLVLHTKLTGNLSFREALYRVRDVALEAYAHQELPFEKLVEELKLERHVSYSPLVQVMFVFQNVPKSALALSGLSASPVEIDSGIAKFDLTLAIHEEGDELHGHVEYNSDLFDAARIARMLEHLQTLLQSIVAQPDQRLSVLPLMPDTERQHVLMAWNDTRTAYPNQCLQQLFEAQVKHSPDTVALVCGDDQMTYRELNRRANQLAHHLQSLGVGPEVLVGLCVERSLEMVIGVLGILKAGGAYVPLDPAYPAERLAFMLDDAQVPVLLTRQDLASAFRGRQSAVICLDADWECIARQCEHNLMCETTPEHAAYVLYTSGSTGVPKGVVGLHRGAVNRCVWLWQTYPFTADEVCCQKTSLNFVDAVWELFGPLLQGIRLVLIPDAVVKDVPRLVQVLAAQQVTRLVLVPSLLDTLVTVCEARQECLPQLKVWISSGEPLSAALYQRFRRRMPYSILLNLYGTSEVAADVTWYDSRQTTGALTNVPLGRPLANTQIYLLDAHQQPVPIGIPGEIYVGGDGLARGYLNRLELTAERFLANPWSHEPGARLYRTGDVARYRSDGNLECLGRIDQQVKIRGYRIELGEIEAVLGQYPGIRETAVVVREDACGDKRLVAYLVFRAASSLLLQEIRRFLSAKLPDYMLPSAFARLDALPRTPNGKLDRQALPAPDVSRSDLGQDFVAPRTPLEEQLVAVWQDVLGIERIGILDNFFALGGHSLLAMQAVSRIRDTCAVELSLRCLFETATIAELAVTLAPSLPNSAAQDGGQQMSTSTSRQLATSTTTITEPTPDGAFVMPMSFAQQRLWFLEQFESSGIPTYTIPTAWRLTGRLNMSALIHSLRTIVQRHESLRTTFTVVQDKPCQIITPHATVALPCIDLTHLPKANREAEALRRLTEEARRPFDLTHGPLLRAMLITLQSETHLLLLAMHHIVSDGWSMDILCRELAVLYEAYTTGKASQLPDLPIQYADFALWQQQWLQGERLEEQLAFWQEHLCESPPLLALPTARPRPAVQTFCGARQFLHLSTTLTQALKTLSQQAHVTLFMTLLTAFKIMLARYTAQDDIVVGTPIANRNRTELEPLIGFFANTLAVRTDLSGNPRFRDLLTRVRTTALDAYAHQDLPFEKLIEALQPERTLSYTPVFQVVFAFQNTLQLPLALMGLTAERVDISTGTVKFDLSLSLWEEAGELCGNLDYNTDLFDAATMARLCGHFQTLLEGIVADPDRRVADLPLLTAAERHQLLVEWNTTATDYASKPCIHQMFATQAARTPEAVALVCESHHLTYQELNSRANQLAHYLRALGIEPEVRVGLCVERSLDMIVGLLGILKAGGAYVPLDPAYPLARLSFMLHDAEIPVLLTQARLLTRLPEQNARVVCLDTDWPTIARESTANPSDKVASANLAYVIYTSGSTGMPKGVAVEHQQLRNYLHGILERLALSEQASFALVSTIAADLGHTVVFASLCCGGCLHVITQERASDPEAMADYMARHAIDCLKIVPSHLAALQSSTHAVQLLPRRLLILGGEASSTQWVERLQASAPHCTILNHYGPTEATVGVLTYRFQNGHHTSQGATLPLGRPLANVQLYLLDKHLRPVPIGVPGEVYIGGLNLARGYLNRPEVTAEKFMPHPFGTAPHARLYKTGDRARYRPDGTLEFLGRLDHQVKVRGFRVEPGEIEAVLAQHPDVQDVAVIAREDTPGQTRLVAYVVPHQERMPTVAGLQRYTLPNNLAVAQLNRHETDYLYKEIFEYQAYMKHGITVHDGDCIFDVGANIGLFTLFINFVCHNPRLYAFEPNPSLFGILQANAALYCSNATLFDCGLSRDTTTATFTFFRGFSLLSGFYADAETDREVVKHYMRNQEQSGLDGMAELIEHADDILDERFASTTFTAQLRTLSSVMAQEHLTCIDLLKINVEKSELDVLAGIDDDDWPKIKQIVVEVDSQDHLESILSLLDRHGYDVAVEQDILLTHTQLCYVYAIRPSPDRRLQRQHAADAHLRPVPILPEPMLSTDTLRRFLQDKLPEYMVPAAFVRLDALPLTPNGKIDVAALPAPDASRPELGKTFQAPRTAMEEQVAAVWQELLGIERIGRHDNFFELGGHSLVAMQVVSRLRRSLAVELPLRRMFDAPTIAELAEAIQQMPDNNETLRPPTIAPVARQAYWQSPQDALGTPQPSGGQEQ